MFALYISNTSGTTGPTPFSCDKIGLKDLLPASNPHNSIHVRSYPPSPNVLDFNWIVSSILLQHQVSAKTQYPCLLWYGVRCKLKFRVNILERTSAQNCPHLPTSTTGNKSRKDINLFLLIIRKSPSKYVSFLKKIVKSKC